MRTRSRGLSLALVLVAMLVLAVVLGALILRTQVARRSVAHGTGRTQARYDAMGDLNQVLAGIRQGLSPSQAAAKVSAATGREILVAGNRVLVSSTAGSFQAKLQARAWGHVLFANSLTLNGVKGAFPQDDPHRPAVGAPPSPGPQLAAWYRDRAQTEGVYLSSVASECVLRPGGGNWRREDYQGSPSWLYLGGGLGDGLGWVAGMHRWTFAGDRWSSSTGDEFQLASGTWVLRRLSAGEAVLAGTLFADGTSLSIRCDTRLQGQVVVWGGGMEIANGLLRVQDPPDTMAVAVFRGEAVRTATTQGGSTAPAALAPSVTTSTLTVEETTLEPTTAPAPGDLVLATGTCRLSVGDLSRPEETGALVLAQGRLVKGGTGLRVAGVVAAGQVRMDGIPATDLVWSGRVGRQPPALLLASDLSFVSAAAVEGK